MIGTPARKRLEPAGARAEVGRRRRPLLPPVLALGALLAAVPLLRAQGVDSVATTPDTAAVEDAGSPVQQAGERALQAVPRVPRQRAAVSGLREDTAAGAGSPAGAGLDSVPEDSLQLVDRVVAVVGDTSILLSDVKEELFREATQQGLKVPEDSAGRMQLMRQVLEDMVDHMVLVRKAEKSDIKINDDELSDAVEKQIARLKSTFSSGQEFQQAVLQTGMNMREYRQMIRNQVRSDMLVQRYRQSQHDSLPPVTVTPKEVRDYFDQKVSSVSRPATISFDRLRVIAKPTKEAEDSAKALAEKALAEARGPTDFAVVARRYSDDPGTRDNGGDLGWIRRSEVVPAFAEAAWSAPLGRAVGPIQTPFGFHVIKVENVRGGERKVRHILIRPAITDSDVSAARKLAEALADSVRAGANIDRLRARYGMHDESEDIQQDVQIDQLKDQLGQAYADALKDAGTGEVVGPFRTQGPGGTPVFAVVKVTDRREQGSYTFDEVRQQIRDNLVQQKQMQQFLDQLRREIYVRIDL